MEWAHASICPLLNSHWDFPIGKLGEHMQYTDLFDNARPLRADASPLGIGGMTSVGYTDVRGQVVLAFYLDDRLRRTLPLKDDEQERFERAIVPALDLQLETDAEEEAKAKAEAEAKAASEAAAKACLLYTSPSPRDS